MIDGYAGTERDRDARATARAALLLEVVVALVIMVAVLAVVGSQMVGGIRMVADAESQTRAGELGDRMMALLDLDQQTQQKVFADLESSGDFGESYPDFMWRVSVEPTEVDGLGQVTLEIVHIDNPEHYGDIEQGQVVRTFHMLKAAPGRIDLVNDFGMNEEQVAAVAQLIPIEGFDPRAMDPQQIASLDPAMLLQLLPQLLPLMQQLLGDKGGELDLNALAGMNPADISPEALRERFAEQIRGMGGADAEAAGDDGASRADDGFGGSTGMGGNRAGGRGGRGGGGSSGASADSLEELRRLQQQFEAGGGPGGRGGRGSGGRGGGRSDVGGNTQPPASGDRAGGGQPGGGRAGGGRAGGGGGGNRAGRGGGGSGGVPPATLEDLERLRQQFEQNQGGGGGRGPGGRGGGGAGRGGGRGGGAGGRGGAGSGNRTGG